MNKFWSVADSPSITVEIQDQLHIKWYISVPTGREQLLESGSRVNHHNYTYIFFPQIFSKIPLKFSFSNTPDQLSYSWQANTKGVNPTSKKTHGKLQRSIWESFFSTLPWITNAKNWKMHTSAFTRSHELSVHKSDHCTFAPIWSSCSGRGQIFQPLGNRDPPPPPPPHCSSPC